MTKIEINNFYFIKGMLAVFYVLYIPGYIISKIFIEDKIGFYDELMINIIASVIFYLIFISYTLLLGIYIKSELIIMMYVVISVLIIFT